MRAARGNTAQPAEGEDAVSVAWWNARVLAAGGDAAARDKLEWLLAVLQERRPTVVFLFEVLGDFAAFRPLRRRLAKVGYSAVFLPSEREGKRDGVAVLVNTRQARLRKTWRVAERTLAARVTVGGETEDAVLVGMHGVTSESGDVRATTRFKEQLERGAEVASEHSGALLGDLNYVPCRAWRRGRTPMNTADRALRAVAGWRCACCGTANDADEDSDAYLVGGDAGVMEDETRGWTRFATSEGAWGAPTSRIDVALAFDTAHRWRLATAEVPQRARPGGGAAVALSDHHMQFMWRPRQRVAGTARERRKMAPKLGRRGDGPERKAILAELLAGDSDVAHAAQAALASARTTGTPATDALIQATRAATDDADAAIAGRRAARKRRAEGSCGGLAGPLRRARMYKARLREVARLRANGVCAKDAEWADVMHPATGMRKYALSEGDGWSLIVYRCRQEHVRARKELARHEAAEARWLIRTAERWAALPEGAVAERQRLAFAMAKKPRAGATLSHVRRRDDPNGELISTQAPDAADAMRVIGDLNVAKTDDGAVVAACQAWHDKFIGQWAALRGAAGGEWTLRREVPFKLWRHVVKTMPVKAAGISGVTVAQLKIASDELLHAVYDAVMHDVEAGLISERWHKVVYVLLEKKAPNDPEIIGQRREIALTEHDVKVLLQAVRRTCYARMLGRTRPQNLGWVPGYGCGDVAQASAWVVQQARALQHPLYLLYADLAQFFPRVHRGCLRVAEVAHGLPADVVRLAAMIYGEHVDDPRVAKCVYDSEGGYGGAFANGQGTLMGCPLSTDRARLFLNSIVAAIEVTAKGVRLWGSDRAARDGAWRRISQLMCADDWLGCFEDVEQLRAAWALWKLWEPITGAKVGIEAADKTVLTGVRYDSAGRAQAVADPRLTTVDGRAVPVRPPSYAYKHLGHWRCANASDATAKKKFRASIAHAASRVRRMPRSVTRFQALVVSDALIGGLACFYLAGMYVTKLEAEKLEAKWRAAFNNRARRARDSPRAELYADKWVPGRTRRHVYAHGLAAVYTAVAAALADVEDLEHRAAVRSGLDLAFYRWGCRQDPRTWDFSHLRAELEASLADGATPCYLGEAWMLAAILLRSQEGGSEEDAASTLAALAENWRWVTEPSPGSPLAADDARATADGQSALAAHVGVIVNRRLLHAGHVRVGHFCVRVLGGARWATYDEARRYNSELQHAPAWRVAWQKAIEALQAAGVAPVAPESTRSARCVWRGATRHTSPFAACDAQAVPAAVDVAAVDTLAAKLHAARRRGAWRVGGRGYAAQVGRWRRAFDACVVAPPPTYAEWEHGVPAAADLATGAHTVFELGAQSESSGGQARWLRTDEFELDEDGCIAGWVARAAGMREHYAIDDDGYVAAADGDEQVRVQRADLGALPVMVQLVARARWELGDVPVVDEPPTKESKSNVTRVNLQAAHDALQHAIRLQCQYEPTHAAATDGTKVTKSGDSGDYIVVARAAVLHDGQRLGGTVKDDDPFLAEHRTTYLAEKAATDDVLAVLPEGSRVVLWLDSISPQQALNRFRRSPARRKRQFHMAARHAASAELLATHEVVVYHWQMSHVGEPANEWADREAAAQAEGEEYAPLVAPICPFASAVFPRDARSTRNWAVRRADWMVAAEMRKASPRSVYAEEGDIVPLYAEPKESTTIPAVRTERCFFSDAGHHWSDAQALWRRSIRCPHGCDAACTWMHFAFECGGCEVVPLRQRWAETVADLRVLAEAVSPHEDLSRCERWLATALDWARVQGDVRRYKLPPGAAEEWDRDELRGARRVLCGHVRSTGCGVLNGKREVREAVSVMAAAGAALMQAARTACHDEHSETVRLCELRHRVALRYLKKLRERVRLGGPARSSRLREIDSMATRVRDWLAPGGLGPLPRGAHAWLLQLRARRAEAQQASSTAGDAAWFLLARLTRWRLRAWKALGWEQERPEEGVGLDSRCNSALALYAAGGIAPLAATRRQLVERAATAACFGRPSRARMKDADARAALKRKHDAAAVPIRAYLRGLSTRGAPLPPVEGTVAIDCRRGATKPDERVRAHAARAQGITCGRLADSHGAWTVDRVLDVRRRAGTRNAIDAYVRWASPDPAKPWGDSWVAVNATMIPSAEVRDEAKKMWQLRGGGGGKRSHEAPPLERAATRPDGEAWGRSLRARPAAARLARDVDSDEEEELRRMEDGDVGRRDGDGARDGSCDDGGRDDGGSSPEARSQGNGEDPMQLSDGGGENDVCGGYDGGDAGGDDVGGDTADAGGAADSDGVTAGGGARCGFCRRPLGCLDAHASCVARALGCSLTPAVAALSATPCLAALERVLCETDVQGDGSCWVYAALAWLGRAEHPLDNAGRPRQGSAAAPTWRDRVADRAMRVAISGWMRANAWVERFADRQRVVQVVCGKRRETWPAYTADRAEARAREVAERMPHYAPGGWALKRAGMYGGDMEFIAVADLTGRAVASYSALARGGDCTYGVALAMPGLTRRGRGSTKHTSVDGALRTCLQAATGVSFAVNINGNHWHALLPVGQDGRARTQTTAAELALALDGDAADAAERWVRQHTVARA